MHFSYYKFAHFKKKQYFCTQIENCDTMQREFILINIIGFDKPGVTSAVTEVLGKYGAFVQDIAQYPHSRGRSRHKRRYD